MTLRWQPIVIFAAGTTLGYLLTSNYLSPKKSAPTISLPLCPPTKVLAVASHVVHGYVGNPMATLCMQILGLETHAINTVNFSNHTGYGQWTGSKTDAETVAELWRGCRMSHLDDFDVLLSGYIPSREVLDEVAKIGAELKQKRREKFFWVLDPVMGDQGRLYVSEELVQGYRSVISKSKEGLGPDLVVPNGFELETISGIMLSGGNGDEDVKGTRLVRKPTGDAYEANLLQVKKAIEVVHSRDGVRMVITTSVRLHGRPDMICVVGSEMTSTGKSRCFLIEVPVLDCFFSGTGDMFAGLMVGRTREECLKSGVLGKSGYASGDDIGAKDLPLARAAVKVLSGMSTVLVETLKARDMQLMHEIDYQIAARAENDDSEKKANLLRTKAAEVRAVRNADALRSPHIKYHAQELP